MCKVKVNPSLNTYKMKMHIFHSVRYLHAYDACDLMLLKSSFIFGQIMIAK